MTQETQDQLAERIVLQDVYYCVSALISALMQESGNATADSKLFGRYGAIDPDDLQALAYIKPDADDYREILPYRNGGEGLAITEGPDGWTWKQTDPADGEVMGEADEPFDTELEAWEDAFNELGLDEPDGSEVYEHWIVSDWLAAKLEARGHPVQRDSAGLTIWGRPTTGQSIAMDAVIRDIAREMMGTEAEAE